MIGRDGWAGLVLLGMCAVLYALTLELKGNPLVPIGPAFYPRIVLAISAVLAALLVVADVLAQRALRPGARGREGPRPNYRLVTLTFAVFGVYVVALPYLGFRVATVLFVAALAVLLEPPRNAKAWAKVLLLAFVATAATYLVFEHYLTVLLPRGKWTGW
ncbi:MAG TPA: tripartite tricarboxylate transporter TctB family protein [Burkholderiales bacterium]|nr:tripartite tricarboxylate transporter TctB family protein [Burkholderiales bacterium]